MATFCRVVALVSLAANCTLLSSCARKAETPAVEEEVVVAEVDVPALSTATEENAEITAALAELDEADRAAAIKQAICPVSDEPLGLMGTPLKVTVAGRDVFICCKSCRDAIVSDPQKYLAKLDAQAE